MTELPSYLTDDLDAPAAPPPAARAVKTVAPQPPRPTSPPRQRGWWRRNLWGLLTILPLALALSAVYLYNGNGYERFWKHHPRVPVAASTGAWVAYSDAKMRLVELVPATDLQDFGKKSIVLPAGLQAWRAVIDIEVSNQESLYGCNIVLEDDQGRLFGDRPDELSSARLPHIGCTAEDEKLSRYQAFAFFVAPANAKPAALRIHNTLSFPKYAKLTVAR